MPWRNYPKVTEEQRRLEKAANKLLRQDTREGLLSTLQHLQGVPKNKRGFMRKALKRKLRESR